jgi:pilus assembly protein CpaC
MRLTIPNDGRLRWYALRWLPPVVLILSLAHASCANSSRALVLEAGASTTIDGVDAWCTPQVRYAPGSMPFYVQAAEPTKLVILAVARGAGEVTITRNDVPFTYRIVVHGLANPTNPLIPGTAPPALGEPHLEPPPNPATATGDVTPVTSSVAPAPASDAPVPLPAAAPLMPTQNALGPTHYISDPAARVPRRFAGFGQPRKPLPPMTIAMMSGTSQVLDFEEPIARVSVSDSKVANVQVINPHELIVVGRTPGFASLIVWDDRNAYLERQIRVEQTGAQQVLLNVTVAEVNRGKMQAQGIDFADALAHYGLSFASLPGFVAAPYNSQMQINGYTGFLPPGGNYYPLGVSGNITYAIGGSNADNNANAFFQFIEDHSLGKVLAEPDLLATSGQEAKFLSGGEIPIIVSQALNTSIVFKQYGTSVVFLPTVIGTDDIELLVKPEVSSPDYTHEVSINGYTVPAFITRRAETLVHLHNNQTLLIAGLLQDEVQSEIRKVPYLGDMPYVGALFRNTTWSHNKTELVMSVTPRLVAPLPAGAQLQLPTSRNDVLTPDEVRTRPLAVPDVTRPRF